MSYGKAALRGAAAAVLWAAVTVTLLANTVGGAIAGTPPRTGPGTFAQVLLAVLAVMVTAAVPTGAILGEEHACHRHADARGPPVARGRPHAEARTRDRYRADGAHGAARSKHEEERRHGDDREQRDAEGRDERHSERHEPLARRGMIS